MLDWLKHCSQCFLIKHVDISYEVTDELGSLSDHALNQKQLRHNSWRLKEAGLAVWAIEWLVQYLKKNKTAGNDTVSWFLTNHRVSQGAEGNVLPDANVVCQLQVNV